MTNQVPGQLESTMSRRHRVATVMIAATLGLLGGGCAGGAASPAWTAAPSSPPGPGTPTPLPTGAGYAGVTDDEFAVLTQGTFARNVAVDPPPPVSVRDAERIVRERFPGDRPLVWAGLVASESSSLVGWMIVLGTAPGQPCDLHPGLLERAFEGGIVDGATGAIQYTFVCG